MNTLIFVLPTIGDALWLKLDPDAGNSLLCAKWTGELGDPILAVRVTQPSLLHPSPPPALPHTDPSKPDLSHRWRGS